MVNSHFVRHFATLSNIFRMANIDFWIQRPWSRVKRYVGLNTNKMPLDFLNDFFQKSDLTINHQMKDWYYLFLFTFLVIILEDFCWSNLLVFFFHSTKTNCCWIVILDIFSFPRKYASFYISIFKNSRKNPYKNAQWIIKVIIIIVKVIFMPDSNAKETTSILPL